MSTISPSLPLNKFIVQTLKKHDITFAPKTLLVAVQHLLDDTLDMYKGIINLGIPPQHIFTLGKCYSNIPRVVQEMQNIGINVIPTTQPALGDFYPTFNTDVKKLWKTVTLYLKQHEIERILVLDDGGMLITSIPSDLVEKYIVCGEEQTTSGLYTFEKNPPAFDVVSEASSAVKLLIESPLFTRAAVERVMERAQERVDFKGKKVGIVGMGSIGTSLAVYLHDLGADVYGFDITPKKAYSLPDRVSVKSASSLQEILITCEYCFGCTGRDIFEGFELPLRHNHDLVLASVSSGDKEFLSLIKYIQEKKYEFDEQSRDIQYSSKYGKITILQQGFPINFDGTQGSAEPRKTQITTAMLLSGIVQSYVRCNSDESNEHFKTILMHSPKIQRKLLRRWFVLLPEMKDLYTKELLENSKKLEWYIENSGGLRATDKSLSRIF